MLGLIRLILLGARLLDAAGLFADLDPIRFDLGVEALKAVRLPFVHEHRDAKDELMICNMQMIGYISDFYFDLT